MGEWVRAKACSTNSCIEIGTGFMGVLLRFAPMNFIADDGEWHVMFVKRDEWEVFKQGVKDGDFDHV